MRTTTRKANGEAEADGNQDTRAKLLFKEGKALIKRKVPKVKAMFYEVWVWSLTPSSRMPALLTNPVCNTRRARGERPKNAMERIARRSSLMIMLEEGQEKGSNGAFLTS